MAMLPRVGDLFGRYRIDSQIGRGGMGVVYGATDTTIERRVALKVVSANLGDSDEFRARFEREAAVLARLDSPHVIAIYDYGTHDDCPYIATQYVGGGDLGAVLRERGPLPASLALRLCSQVADALDDAHRVGVVHRDVKPTNVLLRAGDAFDDLHAYLCDFGIARTASDGLTAPGAVAGTWSYLSPECGRGAPGSPSSDIYALGCLLWATLTGRPPYRGSDVEIAVAHQRDPVPQLPGTDPLVRAINVILTRSMAKDPSGRYSDADQLRSALLAASHLPGAEGRVLAPPPPPPGALSGGSGTGTPTPGSIPGGPYTPPGTPPGSTPWPASAPTRRRGRLVVALAVVAVLAVGGGITAVVQLTGDDTSPPGTTEPGPTDDPTDDPSTEPAEPDPTETGGPFVPERIDEGGPITNDLDGDGLGDLSVDFDAREPNATLSTTWSSTGTTFEEVSSTDLAPYGEGSGVWRLAGQFDDDETTDVLVFRQLDRDAVSVTGELSGGGTVDTQVPRSRSGDFYDAVGDVDGDGRDDLLTVEVTYDDPQQLVFTASVFDGTSFAAPTPSGTLTTDPNYSYVRPGDIDGDGVVDLVSVVLDGDYDRTDFLYPGTLEVRLGDGQGGYGEATATTDVRLDSYPFYLLTGDFDADETDEIVVGDPSSGFISLSTYDVEDGTITSNPSVGSVRYSRVSAFKPGLAVSDVNGDGRDDVVSVGNVRPRGTGRIFVALALDGSFSTRKWLSWDQLFAESNGSARLELLDGARW